MNTAGAVRVEIDKDADELGPTLPPPHACPVDGVVRAWEDLRLDWVRDSLGLDGATCPACHSTFCRPSP